jgi:hypothetical protein
MQMPLMRVCAAPVLIALAACAPLPRGEAPLASAPQALWVQADAGGAWSIRALTPESKCPVLQSAQGELQMQSRAAPGIVAPRSDAAQAEVKPAAFPSRSCEVAWPAGTAEVWLGAQRLMRPKAEPRHIVLIGDTGCRLKSSDQAFQDCRDAAAWPYARIARSAADEGPDLVIHVGDIHYRESPCPASRTGCAASPWGYGQDTWVADLFEPAAPLLAAAPWVFVRGNHESCSRAGAGWFRYLDAHPWSAQAACERPQDDDASDFTEPYAVSLSADTQLIVFDSSHASGKAYPAGHPVALRYAAQLRRVAELARNKPHSFFLNHHPVLAFGGSPSGEPKPGNAGLLSVMAGVQPGRLYALGVDAVLNGHVHLYQALSFAGDQPATLVTGNGGSMMEGHVDPARALRQQPAPGAVVQHYDTQPSYGYATLDREADGWRLTEHAVDGRALSRCRLRGQQLACEPISR